VTHLSQDRNRIPDGKLQVFRGDSIGHFASLAQVAYHKGLSITFDRL
jgi:hypothetical protein